MSSVLVVVEALLVLSPEVGAVSVTRCRTITSESSPVAMTEADAVEADEPSLKILMRSGFCRSRVQLSGPIGVECSRKESPSGESSSAVNSNAAQTLPVNVSAT